MRAFGFGVVDQRLVGFKTREDEIAAVVVYRHRRQRRAIQPLNGSRDDLGLQAKLFGGEQDVGLLERLTPRLELMHQLVGVGGDLVNPRQHH